MPQISRKASTTLSFLFAVLFLLVLVIAAVFLPFLAKETLPADAPSLFGIQSRLLAMTFGYLAIAIGFFADITLLFLLHSVKRERLFTPYCVALLRRLSWCCLGESFVFLPLGILYVTALFISFIALLAGLCLRVVKNAFELAVAMKEENDLTV